MVLYQARLDVTFKVTIQVKLKFSLSKPWWHKGTANV